MWVPKSGPLWTHTSILITVEPRFHPLLTPTSRGSCVAAGFRDGERRLGLGIEKRPLSKAPGFGKPLAIPL